MPLLNAIDVSPPYWLFQQTSKTKTQKAVESEKKNKLKLHTPKNP